MNHPLEAIDLTKAPDFVLGQLFVRPSVREIECQGRTQQIQPRIMKVLVVLARTPGAVISRRELAEQCWDGVNVSDDALHRVASKLRHQLLDTGSGVQIEAIPRVGYRLINPEQPADVQPAPSPRLTTRRRLSGMAQSKWGAPAALVLGVAVIGLVAAFAATMNRAAMASSRPLYEAIAVLPFEDLSRAGELDYLATGAAEEIRNGLASAGEGVRVSARASSSSLAGADLSPAEIAGILKVDALLEGSLVDLDSRTRLSLSLVDPATGHSIWARTFDISVENLDSLRPIIVSDILAALNVNDAARDAPADPSQIDPNGYEQYLKANYYLLRGDTRSVARARALYQELTETAPEFAPAYAKLIAVSLASPHVWNHNEARAYLARAIDLDPWGRETLLVEQLYNDHMRADGMSDASLSRPDEPRRERALDNGARLRTLAVQSRFREAEALAAEIIAHDPIGVETNAVLARVLTRRGKPVEALARLDQALRFHRDSPELRFWRVNALAEAGDFAGALDELLDTLEIAPDDDRTRYFLSLLLGELGYVDEAVALASQPLQKVQALETAGAVSAARALVSAELAQAPPTLVRARMFLILHDLEQARPWLERMYERGVPSNYVEHPSDYKPYLSLAYRQAGEKMAAAMLDLEIQAEIEHQTQLGDESVVLFHPFKAFAAASRSDLDELYILLDQAAAGGYVLFGLDDVIFDHLRDEPGFLARHARYQGIRAAQRAAFSEAGGVTRLHALISSEPNPFP